MDGKEVLLLGEERRFTVVQKALPLKELQPLSDDLRRRVSTPGPLG